MLIEVTEEMKRFNAHICAADAPLEQAPEALQAKRMNPTVNILNSMVYNLMA